MAENGLSVDYPPSRGAVHGGVACEYPQYYSADMPFRLFWMLRPTTAYAWTLEGFPRSATRWHFERR